MERKIKYTKYEMKAVSWCFCVKLSVFKPNRHEQAETGTDRQKTISFERNQSDVIETANSETFRKITQNSASMRNPMQGPGRIGIFMRGRAAPGKIMREQQSTEKSATQCRFRPKWARVDFSGPLWSTMSRSEPYWASLVRTGPLGKFLNWNGPRRRSTSVIVPCPISGTVRLRLKSSDFAALGRKSSVLARGRLTLADIVESCQTSPSTQQQQAKSGNGRKRLGGGIRLFVVQNAGGLAQAGRKGEPAVPVALPHGVFA